MTSKGSFAGKNVLITGAGRGIGKALVKALYGDGAHVYAVSKTADNLKRLKGECPNIETICVDLRDWDATRKALSVLEPMDCLVNNAGLLIPAPLGLFAIKPEDCDELFNINVKSVVNVSQIVVQAMIRRGKGGSIVNISSMASKTHAPIAVAYAMSKGALDVLTRNMTCELGIHKIRVNSVNPFFVDETDSFEKLVAALPVEMMDKITENVSQRCPLNRSAVEMEDVVNSVLFLLGDSANMVNGQTIHIDGGFSAA